MHTSTWCLLEQDAPCPQLVRARKIPPSRSSTTQQGDRRSWACLPFDPWCYQTVLLYSLPAPQRCHSSVPLLFSTASGPSVDMYCPDCLVSLPALFPEPGTFPWGALTSRGGWLSNCLSAANGPSIPCSGMVGWDGTFLLRYGKACLPGPTEWGHWEEGERLEDSDGTYSCLWFLLYLFPPPSFIDI